MWQQPVAKSRWLWKRNQETAKQTDSEDWGEGNAPLQKKEKGGGGEAGLVRGHGRILPPETGEWWAQKEVCCASQPSLVWETRIEINPGGLFARYLRMQDVGDWKVATTASQTSQCPGCLGQLHCSGIAFPPSVLACLCGVGFVLAGCLKLGVCRTPASPSVTLCTVWDTHCVELGR